MNDLIFAIDPGSLKTGWAVLNSHEQLLAGGLILPDKIHIDSEFRIASMCRELWRLLDEWQPKILVIEYGSGKINPRRHHGKGSGLQVHGISIGSLWREAIGWKRSMPVEQQLEVKIVLVKENDWTRGVPKRERAVAIAGMFSEYNTADDPSLDLADAIGLAVFYQREQTVRLAECLV